MSLWTIVHTIYYVSMFGFIPALKNKDNTLEVNALDTRKEGDQINFDLVSFTNVDADGDRLTTRFGIQGQSDHLAKALRKRRERNNTTEQLVAQSNADTAAVINDLPLVDVDRDGIPVAA